MIIDDNLQQLFKETLTSWGFGAALALGLGKLWIDHKLQSERKSFEIKLQNKLQSEKILFESEIRKQVETALNDDASDRQYKLDARKRLYTAVGPLRFQLLLACRDLSNRVSGHGRKQYKFDMDQYYARSFLYRVARPLALFELIERQMSQADFAVDPIGRRLLQFHSAASNIFCGSDIIGEHSKRNMENQVEHIFHSNIAIIASALIVRDGVGERCMRYDEYVNFSFNQDNGRLLEPLRTIFMGFSEMEKPIFWLRLVAYCNLCNEIINSIGAEAGFDKRKVDIGERLRLARDPEILENLKDYVRRCEEAAHSSL